MLSMAGFQKQMAICLGYLCHFRFTKMVGSTRNTSVDRGFSVKFLEEVSDVKTSLHTSYFVISVLPSNSSNHITIMSLGHAIIISYREVGTIYST